jgi:hypothetical protein
VLRLAPLALAGRSESGAVAREALVIMLMLDPLALASFSSIGIPVSGSIPA